MKQFWAAATSATVGSAVTTRIWATSELACTAEITSSKKECAKIGPNGSRDFAEANGLTGIITDQS
jgi:hypothetical protein